jgi:hypothetical protein
MTQLTGGKDRIFLSETTFFPKAVDARLSSGWTGTGGPP